MTKPLKILVIVCLSVWIGVGGVVIWKFVATQPVKTEQAGKVKPEGKTRALCAREVLGEERANELKGGAQKPTEEEMTQIQGCMGE